MDHRFSFVTLLEGGKRRRQIRSGMVASEQKGRVATPPEWGGLEYRVDKSTGPRKVGETPRPAHPVQLSAPASKSTVLPKGVKVWNKETGSAFPEYYPPRQQTKPTPMHNDAAYKQELLAVRAEVKGLRSLVEQVLSYREADQKIEVPDEANTLLRNELADVKKENGKLKEEQLRAAAAAETCSLPSRARQ